ncbi:hypothetical protein AB0E75_29530 [Streptomyces griseoviridis]|jgi:hypothetical protein|uniref:Secreted protein n=3 Tax=Streptomyces TaxID=1883 RepID=A0A918GVE4_STRGD|nr:MULTISPECIES: hypothetical protein [Streptomyces]MDP9679752.1 hypothetical protein [Streptomyces griseoviridis]GGS67712.1 hypothetical protein GCM10010238_65580 [Streptomyces niveoruber]GGT22133.1 hypothetical protein GCM10010240_63550 [Streptomyces griseoviridis]GGU63749.1 hypothetical protein GCM10010259_62780 [Streptomyces daghestanicus]GHI30025.1 hypothetical protein Sdagh_17550 [Streptomyces daghestanicus]
MPHFRHRRRARASRGVLVAGFLACPALFLTQGTATAAPAAAQPWSTAYGTATTAGTWDYAATAEPDRWDVVFDGRLTNTGGECYSTWFAVIYDMSPPVYTKAGTQCGTGTAPVRHSFPSYGWTFTTNVYVTVCEGTTNRADCGPLQWISTVWT